MATIHPQTLKGLSGYSSSQRSLKSGVNTVFSKCFKYIYFTSDSKVLSFEASFSISLHDSRQTQAIYFLVAKLSNIDFGNWSKSHTLSRSVTTVSASHFAKKYSLHHRRGAKKCTSSAKRLLGINVYLKPSSWNSVAVKRCVIQAEHLASSNWNSWLEFGQDTNIQRFKYCLGHTCSYKSV